MIGTKTLVIAAALAASLVTAAPAMAGRYDGEGRGYDGRGYSEGRRHGGDGWDRGYRDGRHFEHRHRRHHWRWSRNWRPYWFKRHRRDWY